MTTKNDSNPSPMQEGGDTLIEAQIQNLVYGPSGSGKTAFAMTFPCDPKKGEWGYVFDFDNGLNTTINPVTGRLPYPWAFETFIDSKKTPSLDIKKLQMTGNAFERAVKRLDSLLKGLDEDDFAELGLEGDLNPHPHVVVLDTLTGLHDITGNTALSLDPKAGLGGTLARQHYLAQMHYVKTFTKLLEGGPWHQIVTAHEVMDKDEVSGGFFGRIVATGQNTNAIYPGYFDEFYHAEIQKSAKGTRYLMRTEKTGYHDAKTRLGFDMLNGVRIFDEVEDVTIEGKDKPRGWHMLLQKLLKYYEDLDD